MAKKWILWGKQQDADAKGLSTEAAIAKAAARTARDAAEKSAQEALAKALEKSARDIRGE